MSDAKAFKAFSAMLVQRTKGTQRIVHFHVSPEVRAVDLHGALSQTSGFATPEDLVILCLTPLCAGAVKEACANGIEFFYLR